MAPGLSCPAVCEIFPDQGWNPCLLHWQADSSPLSRKEALQDTFWNLSFNTDAHNNNNGCTKLLVRNNAFIMSNSLRLCGLYSPWSSPGENTGVGSLSLLQGIFLTQGSKPGLPHCRWFLYQLSHKGSPRMLERVAYPFSSGPSWPRNHAGVSCLTGRFFTSWAISSYIIGSNTWFASFKVHHIQNILRELNMTSGPLLPISF